MSAVRYALGPERVGDDARINAFAHGVMALVEGSPALLPPERETWPRTLDVVWRGEEDGSFSLACGCGEPDPYAGGPVRWQWLHARIAKRLVVRASLQELAWVGMEFEAWAEGEEQLVWAVRLLAESLVARYRFAPNVR